MTDLSAADDTNGDLDMQQLLIKSGELMEALRDNMPSLKALAQQNKGEYVCYAVNFNP